MIFQNTSVFEKMNAEESDRLLDSLCITYSSFIHHTQCPSDLTDYEKEVKYLNNMDGDKRINNITLLGAIVEPQMKAPAEQLIWKSLRVNSRKASDFRAEVYVRINLSCDNRIESCRNPRSSPTYIPPETVMEAAQKLKNIIEHWTLEWLRDDMNCRDCYSH